jgi:hypothetical protein
MWNLYVAPTPMPSTVPAQMPEEPTGLRSWDSGSHPVKSPTTETRSAFGAQTAKRTPPSYGCAPN